MTAPQHAEGSDKGSRGGHTAEFEGLRLLLVHQVDIHMD